MADSPRASKKADEEKRARQSRQRQSVTRMHLKKSGDARRPSSSAEAVLNVRGLHPELKNLAQAEVNERRASVAQAPKAEATTPRRPSLFRHDSVSKNGAGTDAPLRDARFGTDDAAGG